MKRLELTVPTSLLDDLEILSDRFFRHNRSVQGLQSFSVRPQPNAWIVRVHRKGPFKDEATVRREARAIARRYRVARFELLSTDRTHGEYVAWIEWHLPERLRGLLGEEWSGAVPREVAAVGPGEARVVLLASENVLPALSMFVDDGAALYCFRAMKSSSR